MKARRLITPTDTAAVLDHAVQEKALVVLTVQQDNDWISFKSRFLEHDARGRYFVLDYQSLNDTPPPAVLPGQYIGVTFRHRSRKILFSTIVEAKGHYVLEDQSTIPAIRYRWPNSMTELQRRAYYRTPVPRDMTLLTSMWSGGVTARAAAQGDTLHIVTGELGDISCGGAMVRLHQPVPPNWSDGDILGIELQLPDGKSAIQVDGRFRGLRHDDVNMLGAAVQFVGLEMAVDGRAVLQRLAGAVQSLYRHGVSGEQRDESRRRSH